jgi:hypothetical protein
VTWAPDYATSAELKSYLKIDDTADDVFVALWITTASHNVNDFCGRQFGLVASETRTYSNTKWDRHIGCYVTEIDDVMDVVDMTVIDANANEVTDYTLEPENALLKSKPYERILTTCAGPLTIDAPWGWDQAAAGPKVAKLGLFLQAARLEARRSSPFGIAGSPEQGNELRLLAQLDPDFRTSLKPFRREWWAA